MTLQQFIEKWNGKYCEIGGPTAQNQCVDLCNAYINEVLGQPMILWTDAKDFPSKAGEKYEYILNGPTNFPQEGDIVVWSGTWGHVAIALNQINQNSFVSFDQNYPTGSPCHAQFHNYSSVTGWLRYKGQVSDQSLQECLKQHQSLIDQANKKDQLINEMANEASGMEAQITTYQNNQKQLAVTLEIDNQPTSILGKIMELISIEDQLRKVLKYNETLKSSEATLKTELAQQTQKAENTILQNTELSRAVSEATEKEKQLTEEIARLTEEQQTKYKKLIWRFYWAVQ